MKTTVRWGLFGIACALLADAALAGRPVKPPPTPTVEVPVVVDANGTVVGPIVPDVPGNRFAALYRSDVGNIKVLFKADASGLTILNPIGKFFFDGPGCTGSMYVWNSSLDPAEWAPYRFDMFVVAGVGAASGSPKIARIPAEPAVYLTPQSEANAQGVCTPTDAPQTVYRVELSDFPFTGPFTAK